MPPHMFTPHWSRQTTVYPPSIRKFTVSKLITRIMPKMIAAPGLIQGQVAMTIDQCRGDGSHEIQGSPFLVQGCAGVGRPPATWLGQRGAGITLIPAAARPFSK